MVALWWSAPLLTMKKIKEEILGFGFGKDGTLVRGRKVLTAVVLVARRRRNQRRQCGGVSHGYEW